jgi:four helix bundle protein
MFVSEKIISYSNPVSEKSFQFAIRILKFFKHCISKEKSLEVIFKQILKSGTSIGANVAESKNAVSKADFINKLSIALKEVRETEFWLKLLFESDTIKNNEYESLSTDCDELIRLLTSIIKTLKSKL